MASVFKRKNKKSGKWLIAYTDENGARRVLTGAASKTVTEQIAAKLENEARLRRRGVIDARLDTYSKAEKDPLVVRDDAQNVIGGHLADFHKALLAKGTTDKHAGMVLSRAEKVIGTTKAKRISELRPSAAQGAIQSLRDEGLSLQTCNHYLRAVKQFSRWLWRDGRAREDALAHLTGYNVALDRRHDRRALTDDEVTRLIEAAEQGPVVLGMTGPERAMLYRAALGTGFRANELRSLTPESFDLDAGPPTVTVEAAYSKRRRCDEQPIRGDLADLLRSWLIDKTPGKRVFPLGDKPAKMLREDLTVAEIRYRDDSGRVADFHSLRHTYVSNIQRNGASVKVCQELARHSDPGLTLGVYSHIQVGDKTAALEALPPIEAKEQTRTREAARATGTFDVGTVLPFDAADGRAAHAQRADAPKRNSGLPHATDKHEAAKSLKALTDREKCVISGDKLARAPVAQLDRASVYGTEGYTFESCRA